MRLYLYLGTYCGKHLCSSAQPWPHGPLPVAVQTVFPLPSSLRSFRTPPLKLSLLLHHRNHQPATSPSLYCPVPYCTALRLIAPHQAHPKHANTADSAICTHADHPFVHDDSVLVPGLSCICSSIGSQEQPRRSQRLVFATTNTTSRQYSSSSTSSIRPLPQRIEPSRPCRAPESGTADSIHPIPRFRGRLSPGTLPRHRASLISLARTSTVRLRYRRP